MSKFKLINVRLTIEEQKIIQNYKAENKVDIAVLVRDTIKDILLQEYAEIKKILMEIDNKYPSQKSKPTSENYRNKSINIRLDAFLGEVFQDTCKNLNLNYTSIIRGLILNHID